MRYINYDAQMLSGYVRIYKLCLKCTIPRTTVPLSRSPTKYHNYLLNYHSSYRSTFVDGGLKKQRRWYAVESRCDSKQAYVLPLIGILSMEQRERVIKAVKHTDRYTATSSLVKRVEIKTAPPFIVIVIITRVGPRIFGRGVWTKPTCPSAHHVLLSSFFSLRNHYQER